MTLNYKIDLKDGMFKYHCCSLSSFLKIRTKDMKRIYDILSKLNILYELAKKPDTNSIVYGGFTIIFDDFKGIKIEKVSNWLSVEDEVTIIKRELSKYIKRYNTGNIKDIIIKIKSLKKGSSNRIKEELK